MINDSVFVDEESFGGCTPSPSPIFSTLFVSTVINLSMRVPG